MGVDRTSGEVAERWFGMLANNYSSPDCHYHNLHYVAEMLRLLEPYEGSDEKYSSVCFAAWFHDALYDPRKNTDEEGRAAWPGRHWKSWASLPKGSTPRGDSSRR